MLVRRVPEMAYINAVQMHKVNPRDEGYWRDMERLHPEIKVPYAGKTQICIITGKGHLPATKVRTRFGNATRIAAYGWHHHTLGSRRKGTG